MLFNKVLLIPVIFYLISIVAQEAHANPCQANEFRCQVSKLCIDRSLVCDFGHDCGLNDDSDEKHCDLFPGRCDFEDKLLCDWHPVQESWLWIRSQNGDGNARPKTDHTFRSNMVTGHYLLLHSKRRQSTRTFNLVGPRVALREKADECKFRFWLNAPELTNLDFNTKLFVGYDNLNSSRLFSLKGANRKKLELNHNWRRFEVALLERATFEPYQENVIQAMRLELRDLPANFSGYLALDDFSFTTGCDLTFYGQPTRDSCKEEEIFCEVPTPNTNVSCIPKEYQCDFKNDCGLWYPGNSNSTTANGLASDEVECPHKCDFGDLLDDCRYKILDDPAEEVGRSISRAFSFARSSEQLGFVIKSDRDKFISEMNDMMANSIDGFGGNIKRNFVMELPKFSMAHSNCTFEIEFEWSGEVINMQAGISLREERSSGEILLKRLQQTSGRQTASFCIGQQKFAFQLIVEVSFSGDLLHLSDYSGTLTIYSYRFLQCDFFSGLIDKRVETGGTTVVGNDDIDDASWDPPEERETPWNPNRIDGFMSKNSTRTHNEDPREVCELNQLQCHKPIVCVDRQFLCDLQMDCQLSNADEGLECVKYLISDFDGKYHETALAGWAACSPETKPQTEWQQVSSTKRNRLSNEFDPIFDHTRRQTGEGRFLAVTTPGEARIMTSRLLIDAGESDCELVFYVYFRVPDDIDYKSNKWFRLMSVKFENTQDFSGGGEVKSLTLLHELDTESTGSVADADSWRRVGLKFSGRLDFALLFQGYISQDSFSNDLIAIDDVSISPTCRLHPFTQLRPSGTQLNSILNPGSRLLLKLNEEVELSTLLAAAEAGGQNSSVPIRNEDEIDTPEQANSSTLAFWLSSVALLLLISAGASYYFMVLDKPKAKARPTIERIDMPTPRGGRQPIDCLASLDQLVAYENMRLNQLQEQQQQQQRATETRRNDVHLPYNLSSSSEIERVAFIELIETLDNANIIR